MRDGALDLEDAAKASSSRAFSRSDDTIAYANAAPAAAPSRVPTIVFPPLSDREVTGSVRDREIPGVGAAEPFIDFDAVDATSSAVCALDLARSAFEESDCRSSFVWLRATSCCHEETRLGADVGAGASVWEATGSR